MKNARRNKKERQRKNKQQAKNIPSKKRINKQKLNKSAKKQTRKTEQKGAGNRSQRKGIVFIGNDCEWIDLDKVGYDIHQVSCKKSRIQLSVCLKRGFYDFFILKIFSILDP